MWPWLAVNPPCCSQCLHGYESRVPDFLFCPCHSCQTRKVPRYWSEAQVYHLHLWFYSFWWCLGSSRSSSGPCPRPCLGPPCCFSECVATPTAFVAVLFQPIPPFRNVMGNNIFIGDIVRTCLCHQIVIVMWHIIIGSNRMQGALIGPGRRMRTQLTILLWTSRWWLIVVCFLGWIPIFEMPGRDF